MYPITSFTASLGHNGLIDVFAVGPPGPVSAGSGEAGTKVWRARQEAPDGVWSPWSDEGKPGIGAIDVRSIVDADGHGHVLALAGGGRMWLKERKPDDTFTGWQDLGVPPPDSGPQKWLFTGICGAIGPGGRIDVAGTARQRASSGPSIFVRPRPAPGASWSPWSQLTGDETAVDQIYAATTADNALDILVPVLALAGTELGMSHRRRDPDGAWTDWKSLDRPKGGFTGTFAMTTGTRGHRVLDLFGWSGEPNIWHSSQDADDDWSVFAQLGNLGDLVFGLAVARDADGALHLCATHVDSTGTHGTVTHIRQEGAGGPWSEWEPLGRTDNPEIPDPALILGSDKCLNLLLRRRADDGLVTLRQKTKDGPFVKGPAIPALPPH
jgi:hypothetical protein